MESCTYPLISFLNRYVSQTIFLTNNKSIMKRILVVALLLITIGCLFLLPGCRGNNSANSLQQTANSEGSEGSKEIKNKKAKVIINDVTWDEKMESEFKNVYKMDPIPGDYWYDAVSGLWGKKGGPALSFIYPGHNYGKLESNVSLGNTGIFINGREIPSEEAYIWSLVMGVPAQQGRYWLNGQGYVGYEGSNIALFNLFVLAKRNSYQAKGGSDNFWSSSLARGNEEGGFGYVSIPGSGITVTYGD